MTDTVENFENMLLELCDLCSQNKQSLLGKIGMKQARLVEMFKERENITLNQSNKGWISVDDELPKEFEKVLLFGKKYNGEPLITDGHLIQSLVDEFGINDGFSVKMIVTHWQPLPEPAKE